MKTKGSLRRISPELYGKIQSYVLAEENRATTRSKLAEELETHLGKGSPSYETLLKLISRIRNYTSPLENPWHIGLMRESKYSIPPDTVTIRQALWISRLQGIARLLSDGKTKGKKKGLDPTCWLWQWSKAYAQYEILCELSSTPQRVTEFDTSKLDKAIRNGATPISANNAIDLFFPDNHIETVIEKKSEVSSHEGSHNTTE